MDLFHGILLIASIHFLAATLPGPDFVYTTSVSITQGKKAGLLTALGITLGLSLHIIYSIFGLALVISKSVFLLELIKIIGGAYLIYLGFSSFFAKNQKLKSCQTKPRTAKSYLLKGILCNVLNPKAPIYFVSVFTIVLSPNLPFSHLLIYGFVMMVVQFLVFTALVYLLCIKRVQTVFERFNTFISKALGVLMVSLGLKVLFAK